jgi:ribose-phosphate pyrophosphokinase
MKIIGDLPEPGFKVIIIDDLCSKGGTFILSAEKLKAVGAAEVYLIVAHCEEAVSQGKILESDLITKVFTTDSILQPGKYPKIQVFTGRDW